MKSATFILAIIVLAFLAVAAFADVPQMINYQGRLTDASGNPVADGDYLLKFTLWDSPEAGTQLWTSGFRKISVSNGLFSTLLGDSIALPTDFFGVNAAVFLGITVGVDNEITPRTHLVAVPYARQTHRAERADTATYADLAERAIYGRDLYHQILDVNPNSVTTIHFLARSASPDVVLYLYGSQYQGTLAQHTHDGVNSHAHGLTGSVASSTVPHTHGFSGTTGNGGAAHSHTGTTDVFNLAHSHSGTTGSYNLSHQHGGTTSNDGHHHHDFIFQGVNNGLFLTHTSEVNSLTAHGTWSVTASGSVATTNSDHQHGFTTGLWGSDHSHSFTSGSWGGNHNHTFTSGNTTATHSHSFSGTTGSQDILHSHSFSGTVSTAGSGLLETGIEATSLPSQVTVYVDGALAAGPFNGPFSSGALDISSLVNGEGIHIVEIRVEGNTGGRISYNLFVE